MVRKMARSCAISSLVKTVSITYLIRSVVGAVGVGLVKIHGAFVNDTIVDRVDER